MAKSWSREDRQARSWRPVRVIAPGRAVRFGARFDLPGRAARSPDPEPAGRHPVDTTAGPADLAPCSLTPAHLRKDRPMSHHALRVRRAALALGLGLASWPAVASGQFTTPP